MNLNDDIVNRCIRLGPLHQRHPGRSRSLIRDHNRFHFRHLSVSVPRLHGDRLADVLLGLGYEIVGRACMSVAQDNHGVARVDHRLERHVAFVAQVSARIGKVLYRWHGLVRRGLREKHAEPCITTA